MPTQTFHATGLTCEHCASAVQEELTVIESVVSVDVTPVKDGISTIVVRSARDLTDDEVIAALDEAGGYVLASASGI